MSIFFPLIFSFESKIKFYARWKNVFFAIGTVGSVFVVWDVIVTRFGHWKFNSDTILGIHIINLPIEEVMFFVFVPYACLFLYEMGVYFDFFKNIDALQIHPYNISVGALGVLLSLVVLIMDGFSYSFTSVFSFSTGLFAISLFERLNIKTGKFVFFLGVSFVGFLVVNSMLTYVPVVIYNPEYFSGIRVWTIPVEDFGYNFAMLTWYLVAYQYSKSIGFFRQ